MTLIDVDNLKQAIRDDAEIPGRMYARMKMHIEEAEAVDAKPVVHGWWIVDKVELGNPYDGNCYTLVDIGNCSVCGHRCEMLPIMNYCPNCGAKMDGGADNA